MKTESGTPFWGGPKRPPTPITFNLNDETHMEFIVAAANLRAEMYGLTGHSPSDFDFSKVIQGMKVPAFKPKSNVKIATSEKEAQDGNNNTVDDDDDDAYCRDLLKKIPKPSDFAGYRLNAIEFEKDDDTNHHIDFIAATSNLRARNYKIPEGNKHKIKGIAGKIIPAMVTTTSLITGLTSLEFYKVSFSFFKKCVV
jgi:ubiquitin-activating enzyme E1